MDLSIICRYHAGIMILLIEYLRGLYRRYHGLCWCWLEVGSCDSGLEDQFMVGKCVSIISVNVEGGIG